jgi:flagellar biosynthetic protein FliO
MEQLVAVIFVFALLGGALWFVKKRPRLAGGGGARRMQVVERVALTPHHSLCLVKVDGRTLMIGTAPTSCQLLIDTVTTL